MTTDNESLSPAPAGYERHDRSISIVDANVYGTLAGLLVAAPLLVLYLVAWGFARLLGGLPDGGGELLLAILLFVAGVVVHELLHGLTWALAGDRGWSAVSFGVLMMTPYAHISEPLRARPYQLGAFMPGLLLGIVPALAAVVTGNAPLFLFGLLFTVAAGGDFYILWLVRDVPSDALLEDHPSRGGCYVLLPLTDGAGE